MFWLTHYFIKSYAASLLSGFMFTFSNFHFMHAQGHMQFVALQWLPLFLLSWFMLLNKPSTVNAIFAALALFLVISVVMRNLKRLVTLLAYHNP